MLEQPPPALTDRVADGVGSTPLVKIGCHNKVQLLAKLEFANPTGSGKDRVAKYLLEDYEQRNSQEDKKLTLIIPTTGNLGISIATLAAKRKHRVIAIVPERTSNDRILLLKALGAEILRSPNEARPEAPESAFSVAARLAEQIPNAVVMDETRIHKNVYDGLAEELLQQTDMKFDYLFVGVESGGTITGLANYIKQRMPHIKVIGVEPSDSDLSESTHSASVRADWKIEDLGNTFVPPSLTKNVVDEWIKIHDKEGFSVARRLIRDQGILCGPSSGAVVAAATQHANTFAQLQTTRELRSVVILSDTARNYTSTLLSDDWLFENDLADDIITRELEYLSHDRYRAASVEDLQLPAAVTIAPSSTVAYAMDVMLEREFSQLPVIRTSNKKLVGYVSLAALQARLDQGTVRLDDPVDGCMFTFRKGASHQQYQTITPDTSLADLAKFFELNSFAVVTDGQRKWCLGVATKYDLISFLHRRQFL
ncbi:hypothetical protein DFQ28_002761 [Apophysomyces sp. BC1034]|nr:hypothetical protein DFQ30_005780 [Apophysomyces sp. BC1015]KAG0182590.1 hypothetical protein DFQ29_003370 [Apophysomyces sp. BC1021]KAG0193886.1 hypothetical protein DFQ28_002761 [Apophysomyces sp. BC1034]